LPDLRSLRLSRKDARSVASGFASGERPTADLVAAAVEQALAKADSSIAGSILLLLTPHFGRNTQLAVSTAARVAHCVQVAGCTAAGVFTESEWSLDAPAAAALVLCGDTGLVAATAGGGVLTLATATAAQHLGEIDAAVRFGMYCADGEGDLPARVWSHGRIAGDGHCALSFSHARTATRVSRGLKVLSDVMAVTGTDGYDIFSVDDRPAMTTLLAGLPPNSALNPWPPFSQLFAAVTDGTIDPGRALKEGRYHLVPIIGISHDEQSLTLALPLDAGDRLFWTLRQPAVAERDSIEAVAELDALIPEPDFALMFSCIGRGPYFFGSADHDLACLRERFPAIPILGAYGAGEIGPVAGKSTFLSYSAVMTLIDCVHT